MCSNKKTLACIFDNGANCSILSDTYKRNDKSKRIHHQQQQQQPLNNNLTNQIHIKFKNKTRLLTGIDETTTFSDLKLALVITYYKKRLSKSNQPEEAQLRKFQKNFEHLKKVAADDYVICESTNEVEKVIDSDQNVRSVLKRIHRESVFLNNFNVTHSMRLKRSLLRLSPDQSVKKMSKAKSARRRVVLGEPREVPILEEFFPDNDENEMVDVPLYDSVPSSPLASSLSSANEIDEQLKCFDVIIKQRKEYIQLLERYLNLSDELEADMKVGREREREREAIPHLTLVAASEKRESESDSTDTGFHSVNDDSVSTSESLSDRLNEWCVAKAVPEKQRAYFQKISNFETYV